MAPTLYSGFITIPGTTGDREVTLEIREQEERNAVLEICPRDLRLSADQLRAAAEELVKKEEHLKFMRKKYSEMAGAVIMLADEVCTPDGRPWIPPEPEEGEEEEEGDDRWIGEIIMEEGELLDSKESDTGNPMSGDSVTDLYEYEGRFWLVNGIHCWARDYDTYEEARDILFPEGSEEEEDG